MRRASRRTSRRTSRLRVRPTARGWQALVIGIIVMVVARLIGTTQFYQLSYVLLGLVAASLVLGYFGSRGLRYDRTLPPDSRITAGTPARIDLLLSNVSRFDTSRVEVVDRLPEQKTFEVPRLWRRGGDVVEVEATFPRRGVYELGPAEVRATDPISLLRFIRRFEERTEVVVYPEVHDMMGFPLGTGDAEAGTSGYVGQRGDEFAGLREYRQGDDRRHIYWKSVARTGELYVKEFALHAPQRYTVALDLRQKGLRKGEREVEDAVSAAASILTHLFKEQLPFRLLCTNASGDATGFGSDERSYWKAMRLLATVRADGRTELGGTAVEERERLGEGVVLILRNLDDGMAGDVQRLRRAGLSVTVVALALHTYRSGGREDNRREIEFVEYLGRLEAAGARVLAVRHPAGVAGLAGASVGATG